MEKNIEISIDDIRNAIREITNLKVNGRHAEAIKFGEKEQYKNCAEIQIHVISAYIKLKRYTEAEELAKRFEEDEGIQSQVLRILIDQGKYTEAEKIGKRFPNIPDIQLQIIKMYIKQSDKTQIKSEKEIFFEKIKQIGERCIENQNIQLEVLKILVLQEKYDEAEKIGKKFSENVNIQLEMVRLYLKIGRQDDAIKIANRFPEDEAIHIAIAKKILKRRNKNKYYIKNKFTVLQIIRILIKKGELEEAKKLGREHQDYDPIQEQMMRIAVKEGDDTEVYKIGEAKKENAFIQKEFIRVLVSKGEFERAEKIGTNFKEDPEIQLEVMDLLIKLGKVEKAKGIGCSFPNNTRFRAKLIRIYLSEGNREEAKRLAEGVQSDKEIAGQYGVMKERKTYLPKNKMRQDKRVFDIEAIIKEPNSDLAEEFLETTKDELSKLIIGAASLEQGNQQNGQVKDALIRELKEIKSRTTSKKDYNHLTRLIIHLREKQKIYDQGFYTGLLRERQTNLPNGKSVEETRKKTPKQLLGEIIRSCTKENAKKYIQEISSTHRGIMYIILVGAICEKLKSDELNSILFKFWGEREELSQIEKELRDRLQAGIKFDPNYYKKLVVDSSKRRAKIDNERAS